jgi:hypothetical protein
MSLAPAAVPVTSWATRLADLLDPPKTAGDWTPYPKQKLATELAAEADETLFGGSAGPGKTEWGLRHVITQMELYPGNRGVIFRRVFPSLSRSVIPRLKILLFKKAKWNGNDHTFTFPNTSILEVGSLQYEDSVLDYQGAEYGVIFFEEITEFLQSQWEYMLGRLRPPATMSIEVAKLMRPHAIATTNPGGRGHRWVKRRWVKPDSKDLRDGDTRPAPYKVWRPRARPDQDQARVNSRVYVPATHADNPALLEKDPGYLARIQAQSNRGLRLAMEHGDWDAIDAVVGALWRGDELDLGRVSPLWFSQKVTSLRRVVAVDPSDGIDDNDPDAQKGDAFGVCVASKGMDGVGYVEHSDEWHASPRKMAERAIDLYKTRGADALVIERNHGGKWMIEVFRSVDPYVNIIEVWASDNKRTRAEPVAALFEPARRRPERPFDARLVGFHDKLEEELTSTRFDTGERSPNQLDAMVWAMTELMLGSGVVSQDDAKDERHKGRR